MSLLLLSDISLCVKTYFEGERRRLKVELWDGAVGALKGLVLKLQLLQQICQDNCDVQCTSNVDS